MSTATTTPAALDITAELARLRAENEMLKQKTAASERKLSVRYNPEKGTVSVAGLNARFPTSLYPNQWIKLNQFMPQVLACLAAHKDEIDRQEAARAAGK
jgi:hypothetical protein